MAKPTIPPTLTPAVTSAHLILLLAVLAMSTSVIFIKACTIPPAQLAAGRLLLAALILLPFYLRARRNLITTTAAENSEPRSTTLPPTPNSATLPPSWPLLAFFGGLLLGGHFLTWNLGARLTQAANATLIVNSAPVVLPWLLLLLAKERLTRRHILGTVVASLGLLVLALTTANFRPELLRGDLTCFASMLVLAGYIAWGRKVTPRFQNSLLYIVPMYFCAGILCLGVALLTEPWALPARAQWPYLLALTLIPTLIGHSLANWCLSRLPGQVVGLGSQLQFPFAAALAWIFLQDRPSPFIWPAGALVLAGCLIAILAPRSTKPAT